MNTKKFGNPAKVIKPGSFEMGHHYYPRVQNAHLHPMVSYFLKMSNERIINRYCHLHPQVFKNELEEILKYQPKYIPWAGCDLFNVTTSTGIRQMIVIETNSCPSGQKSMPPVDEHDDQGGYLTLMQKTFQNYIPKKGIPNGSLAVVYDKNEMENSGYAATMADVFNEEVYLVEFYNGDPDPSVRFTDGVMEVRDEQGNWNPIRAAFRYVTQKPWNRIPVGTKTIIFNPILSCLAGGRNKMVASKAYDIYNAELARARLSIRVPETICDVEKDEVPLWVQKFGGHAVIKVPYSNAGQGIYTITNEEELSDFMGKDIDYSKFIVQSLIGNFQWSTLQAQGKFYHVGTLPNKHQNIYVADIRMMVCRATDGYRPIAIYSRRSKEPLVEKLEKGMSSWEMLGTNLSIKKEDGTFDTDSSRLMMMDRKEFNSLGLGLDDLIEGYIQTVLSVIAIDKMASSLVNKKGKLKKKLFKSLNDDEILLKEIMD